MALLALGGWLIGGCVGQTTAPAPIVAWLGEPVTEPPGRLWGFDAAEGVRELWQRPADGWRVRPVADAPSPPAALCRDPSGEAAVVLSGEPLRDFDLRVRVWAAARGHESMGVAFRWQDPDNYLLARANSRNNNLRLYRRERGQWALLGSRDLPLPVGRWHELAVRARGAELVVGLAGEPLLMAQDRQLGAGAIALWAEADAEVCFDDLWIDPRPEPR